VQFHGTADYNENNDQTKKCKRAMGPPNFDPRGETCK